MKGQNIKLQMISGKYRLRIDLENLCLNTPPARKIDLEYKTINLNEFSGYTKLNFLNFLDVHI